MGSQQQDTICVLFARRMPGILESRECVQAAGIAGMQKIWLEIPESRGKFATTNFVIESALIFIIQP